MARARLSVTAFVACSLLAAVSPSAAHGEVTLKVAGSWDLRQHFTREFMNYVDDVNARGKGVVRLEYIGGPEVIPQRQLLYALRRGVIDAAFGSITYYRGVLPEGDAIYAASITPQQARATGALEALQAYWNQRINAHLVGWLQSGIGVNFYLTTPPQFDAGGLPDLSGLKIRTSPSNREIVTHFGARAVQIALKEVYTALQRGTVDGLIFTTTGLPDLGVESFIRYRVDPAVLQMAITFQVNLDTWNALPAEARRILDEAAIDYEFASRQHFEAIRAREVAELAGEGLVAVQVDPALTARYRQTARDVAWDRLAQRAPEAARRLRPLFAPGDVE